jgi:hypothetical protein
VGKEPASPTISLSTIIEVLSVPYKPGPWPMYGSSGINSLSVRKIMASPDKRLRPSKRLGIKTVYSHKLFIHFPTKCLVFQLMLMMRKLLANVIVDGTIANAVGSW